LSRIEPDGVTTVHPGQTLILHYRKMISAATAAEIKKQIDEHLPGVDVMIIGGADHVLVYEPEPKDT
jgi:hypothetical protein